MDSFLLQGYEDLEISTQIIIREAIFRSCQVEVVDRKENFLRIKKDNISRFVKEASKTELDSFMTYLVMENKSVSKIVLSEAGIRVPNGAAFSDLQKALEYYPKVQNLKKVVKPVTTNFGLGIGITKPNEPFELYKLQVETAFSLSSSIIVEEFIEGPEYRFLVIGEEVVAICNRIPANVKGDGKRNISELVDRKNLDPRRGLGHKTPLEKIQKGEIETQFLKSVGYDWNSIPSVDEVVYLRKNSNISTGGDSIDRTDSVHPGFKEIALRSAKAAGAKICGIDIISETIESSPTEINHAVLEINFNPVLYIHEFPYEGKSRKVGVKVLELLGL